MPSFDHSQNYLFRSKVEFDCGLNVDAKTIFDSVILTNERLATLPFQLWQAIDLKSTGAIIGAYLSTSIAEMCDGIVNPIEKGHPDVLPKKASNCTEEELRKYPEGIEVKGTCGGIKKGVKLDKGQERTKDLTGIVWQAHHREVEKLLGTVWDFRTIFSTMPSPTILAAFYSEELNIEDWGQVSGTTGRNTKVSAMVRSGKRKMGDGAICIINEKDCIEKYSKYLDFNHKEFGMKTH